MSFHLHIDPFSGIAGDMFIGAMIDIGADLDALRQVLAPLPVELPYHLWANRCQRRGIGGVDFKVMVEETEQSNLLQPTVASHRHTGRREIAAMIEQLHTTPRGRSRATRILDALAKAEAEVHGTTIDQVHFHEVGAVDSIVDMLGSAAALELLNIDSVSCGPLPLSRGFVRCDHGKMPVPAPATALLMRGMPTFGVDRANELITPTGAAILAGVVDSFGPPPPMTLCRVGYGAGDRDDPEVPNLLRVFLGKRSVVR